MEPVICSWIPREAKVLIEEWRRHFNEVRPHSTRGRWATESSYTTSSARPRNSICRFTCRGLGREKGCSWGIQPIASGSHLCMCAMTGSSRFSVEYSSSRNVAVFRRLDLGVTSLASEEWHRLTKIDMRNK